MNSFFKKIVDKKLIRGIVMKKFMYILTVFALNLLWLSNPNYAQIPEKFQLLIDQGEFSKAQQLMVEELVVNLEINPSLKLDLTFQIERLERIKKDFTATKDDILNYIKQYVPDVKEAELDQWEKEKSLECMIIDGQKRYFKNVAPNLFRINKRLKKIKAKASQPGTAPLYNRLEDVRNIIKKAKESGNKFVNPVRVRITYKLSVNKDMVPKGKIIRCWLPYPREIPNRQMAIKLVSTRPTRYIIAPNDEYLQRTIYLEQPAQADEATMFQVIFEVTTYAVYQKIDPQTGDSS